MGLQDFLDIFHEDELSFSFKSVLYRSFGVVLERGGLQGIDICNRTEYIPSRH
jgi:hypothetical protein